MQNIFKRIKQHGLKLKVDRSSVFKYLIFLTWGLLGAERKTRIIKCHKKTMVLVLVFAFLGSFKGMKFDIMTFLGIFFENPRNSFQISTFK